MRYGKSEGDLRIQGVLAPLARGRVMGGPFEGLFYVEVAVGSAIHPKIIGSYERELNAAIEAVIARAGAYSMLVDIGGAEGYYAVGLARRCPALRVQVFEGEARGRELCQQMARANGVQDRLTIEGYCDVPALQRALAPNALVICDCEGSEVDLLVPDQVPALASAELIVELHPFVRAGATETILARFRATHEATLIDSGQRAPADYPVLQSLRPRDQKQALSEQRPQSMQWVWLRPRA